jgi:hypothetical protein
VSGVQAEVDGSDAVAWLVTIIPIADTHSVKASLCCLTELDVGVFDDGLTFAQEEVGLLLYACSERQVQAVINARNDVVLVVWHKLIAQIEYA